MREALLILSILFLVFGPVLLIRNLQKKPLPRTVMSIFAGFCFSAGVFFLVYAFI